MMSAVLAMIVALRRPWKVMNIMSQVIRYSHQLHSQPSNAPQTKIQRETREEAQEAIRQE
jgi:hypothetical protein